jgi:hypothetical protein
MKMRKATEDTEGAQKVLDETGIGQPAERIDSAQLALPSRVSIPVACPPRGFL